MSKFNKTQNKESNFIDKQISNANNNKKRGINLVINGKLENKMNGNMKINTIIYNMNKNNQNLNINNSNSNFGKNSKFKNNVNMNVSNTIKKNNNIIKNNIVNNQKLNYSRNSKNKNQINPYTNASNAVNCNNGFINSSSKKNEDVLKKTKKNY